MLLKVELVEEIGRFAVLKHSAPHFGSLTMLFARNGYGKSTLCSVIRSAAEQDSAIISARRRLGALKPSTAHLHWKTHGAVTYSLEKWNSSPGPIHIFDEIFIRRNLHVGESVTRDNKRSLIPIILGEKGVELAAKITALDVEQRDLAIKQNDTEKLIKRTCPSITEVKAFVQCPIPDDIEAKIISASKSLELAKQAIAVKQKLSPKINEVIEFQELEALLAQTISSISDAAGEIVEQHLSAHSMRPNGARWLKYGVEHIKDDHCPFCTQDTSKIELIDIFKGYFSKSYSDLEAEIDAKLTAVQAIYGEDGILLTQELERTKSDLIFWVSVCEIPNLPTLSDDDVNQLKSSFQDIEAALKNKRASPLRQVEIMDAANILDGLSIYKTYQSVLSECIAIIEEVRVNIGTKDIKKSQEVFDKFEALRKKATPPLRDEAALWSAIVARRAEIESEKKVLQETLRTHTLSTIGTRQKTINELLDNFGARFQICETKTNFVGREANLDYCISIGAHKISAGERLDKAPSFNTVLSSGDKSTLALVFFLLQVRESASYNTSTIILDDPFNSQDIDRQFETTSQIRSLAKDVSQVIVLSHDPRFLALIEKNSHNPCHSFQIVCDEDGKGSISQWKSSDELADLYLRQSERIREYAKSGHLLPMITPESLVKDLRPFLEEHLRMRFPGRFAPRVMLNDMITKIEETGVDDHLYPRVPDLRSINEYTRDYMHGGAAVPVPAALKAQCKRIVSIVGAY